MGSRVKGMISHAWGKRDPVMCKLLIGWRLPLKYTKTTWNFDTPKASGADF